MCARQPIYLAATTSGGRPFFDAALEAAEGKLWLRDGQSGDFGKPLYRTQARHIETAARLLGLSGEQDQRFATHVAGCLYLPLIVHSAARAQMQVASGLRERGGAIRSALDALPCDEGLWSRVLHAGWVAELWGKPWLWDSRINQRLFPGDGTPVFDLGRSFAAGDQRNSSSRYLAQPP